MRVMVHARVAGAPGCSTSHNLPQCVPRAGCAAARVSLVAAAASRGCIWSHRPGAPPGAGETEHDELVVVQQQAESKEYSWREQIGRPVRRRRVQAYWRYRLRRGQAGHFGASRADETAVQGGQQAEARGDGEGPDQARCQAHPQNVRELPLCLCLSVSASLSLPLCLTVSCLSVSASLSDTHARNAHLCTLSGTARTCAIPMHSLRRRCSRLRLRRRGLPQAGRRLCRCSQTVSCRPPSRRCQASVSRPALGRLGAHHRCPASILRRFCRRPWMSSNG